MKNLFLFLFLSQGFYKKCVLVLLVMSKVSAEPIEASVETIDAAPALVIKNNLDIAISVFIADRQSVSKASKAIKANKTDDNLCLQADFDGVVIAAKQRKSVLSEGGVSEEVFRENLKKKQIKYYLGDSHQAVKHDDYLYTLPFAETKRYRISQANFGKQSHNHPDSFYAFDFQLEVGEAVHAAREGRVVNVIEHHSKSGGPEFRNKANLIMIHHSDNTLAHYVHLQYQGAVVEPGDWVEAGQLIGYSGMTGFTKGPHLHFVVRGKCGLSVPVKFEGYENTTLKANKKVKRKAKKKSKQRNK